MKIFKVLLAMIAVLVIYSCNKVELAAPEDFLVQTDKDTYAVNEDVTFRFLGNPNNISFYSGEVGRSYEFRTRLSSPGAKNELSFSTQLANLPAGSTIGQTNNLKFLVSSNFNGRADSANIRNAVWKDMTSKVTLASNATSTASGVLNVSDFQTEGDTVYVAFRYSSQLSSPTSRARAWTVSSLTFKNTFPDGTVYSHNTVTTDVRNTGFRQFSYKGGSVKDSLKWAIGSTLFFPAGIDDLSDEDWSISKPFKLSKIANDNGVGIKDFTVTLAKYTYKFKKAGTYNVTFVANNATGEGVKEVVRQLVINIK
ncbi:DUF5017 domain-containing protein [Pedobacter sp. MC2016-24]|uniref:DUF5017 domain-containing protein n=1 Tax=Pedobacter sp. MC2016-24 TaxID=2780090 RepID=UPI0018815A5E|nr:DUF5017 domain-containing protein [Pedobacter sp. MC2016-24]MBE9599823.1 DUF5017 domain-containing protein [Pedobacter sp. MC2016-24]